MADTHRRPGPLLPAGSRVETTARAALRIVRDRAPMTQVVSARTAWLVQEALAGLGGVSSQRDTALVVPPARLAAWQQALRQVLAGDPGKK